MSDANIASAQALKAPGVLASIRHFSAGYVFTLINAYTVIFWLTISAQVVALTHHHVHGLWWLGAGLMCGTVSWVLGLNTVLCRTRHKLSLKWMIRLNIIGALMLVAFAIYALAYFLL